MTVVPTADVGFFDRLGLGLFPSAGSTLGDGDNYLSSGRVSTDGGNGNGGGGGGTDDGGDLQLASGLRWKRRGGVAGSKTINSGKVDFGHRGVSGIDLSGGSRDGVNFAKGSRVSPRVLPQQPSRHRASKRRVKKKKSSKINK
jgi:hypothetical protein